MGSSGETVKGLYAAFGRGDVAAVLAALDPQIEWLEAENSPWADGNPYIGPQSVVAGVFARILGQMDGFTLAPGRFVDAGDTVLVEGRYSGRMKATGKPVDAQFAHVWQVRDGKVVRFQQYTDTSQWTAASRP